MILRDRVNAVFGGYIGKDGRKVPEYDSDPIPADVQPLRSSEQILVGRTDVTALYRVVMQANSVSAELTPSTAIKWRGKKYTVEGDVEPHSLNGAVHHYEMTVRRT